MNQSTDPQPKPVIGILLFKTVQLLLISPAMLPLWMLYGVGRLVWERPPNVPHLGQAIRYLRLTWHVQPSPPGLSWQARAWLTLTILSRLSLIPLSGLAWLLDELLYGHRLNKVDIIAPLFVTSGGRSGSTQMTRYLEADPTVTAPNLLQSMFPYLWLWRLAPCTLGHIFTPEKVRARLKGMLSPELLERHEFDPFKADTFDGALWGGHLNPLTMYMGPTVSAVEFSFATFSDEDRERLERDFVRFIDRIGRKQLLYSGETRRLFIKGHFLNIATVLACRYPDACFLTLLRDPVERLQSGINYLRVNPADPAMGPPPWAWLAASLLQTESEYCRIEMAWFIEEADGVRYVVRFADFVADLEGTMRHVYRNCFGLDELPPHVPHAHPPRERKPYTVNRSLAELGIDAGVLRAELAEYVAWCRSQEAPCSV